MIWELVYSLLIWFLFPLFVSGNLLREKPYFAMVLGFPMLILMWVLFLVGSSLVVIAHKLHFILMGKSFDGKGKD